MANEQSKSAFKEMVDLSKELLELNLSLAEGDEKRMQSTMDMANVLQDVVDNQTDSNKLSEMSSDLEDQLLVAKEQGNKELIKQINLIQKVIKAKQKENKAQDNINDALLGAADDFGIPATKISEFYKTINGEGGKMVGTIMIASAVILGMVGLFMKMSELTDEVGEKFGAIGVNEFGGELMKAKSSAIALGYGFDEMAGSVGQLSDNFGVTFDQAVDMSEVTMDTARAVGITTDNAAKLTGMLMKMGGHSAETAQNFIKQTAALAASAGVAPGTVLNDMASASADVAGFMKDGGHNIAQAAVKARTLGINISDVAQSAKGMLNFTDSIQKELEASVMIGRQLNFQKARELALMGDLSGYQNEILRQVGGEAQWNKMNVLQREAMAAAVGLTVDQMSKLVTETGKSTAELAKMRSLDISEIASDEALSSITLLLNNMKALGVSILSAMAWLSSFGGLLDGTAPVIQMIGAAVGLTVAAIAGFWLFGKLAAIGVTAFSGALGPLTAALTGLGTAGSIAIPILFAMAIVGASIVGILYGVGYVVQMIGDAVYNIGKGIAVVIDSIANGIVKIATPETALGVLALAGAFWLLSKSLGVVGAMGWYALPAMLGLLAFTAGMAALGFSTENIIRLVHGPAEGSAEGDKVSKMEEDISAMKTAIESLVVGFGADPKTASSGVITDKLSEGTAAAVNDIEVTPTTVNI